MTGAPDVRKWIVVLVAVLTAGWLVALVWVALRWFGTVVLVWLLTTFLGKTPSAAAERDLTTTLGFLAAVAVGGPALIALVAFAGRMPQIGVSYVATAVLLGVLALAVAVAGGRGHTQQPEPVSAPAACQEHSGEDHRCPGN